MFKKFIQMPGLFHVRYSTVCMEIRDLAYASHISQFMASDTRIEDPAETQGVHKRIGEQSTGMRQSLLIKEIHIEIHIVTDKDRVSYIIEKLREGGQKV